jgi:site-specific DNA-methyltransferase (adenine-specific)
MELMNNYNPDVLNCLANLSSDEVFTPPNLVNQILDLLPQSIWKDKNAKFLDPVCKSGVFLREIAKRLMTGLEKEIPDQQKRINHIFQNQLYGIAITELTSLLSRRSVYCSKKANGKYSVADFKTEDGNIFFKRMNHSWVDGKCKYCSASQKEYGRDSTHETYAYNFIHTIEPNKYFNMKFDVIIGNPPYQLSDGSGASSDAALPVYDKFIEQAMSLNPKYLVMITPSKWMVGGRGLKKFREKMTTDTRIKYVYDFENASECFPGVHIDGGVSYFLWDKDYNGKAKYVFKANDGTITSSLKYLKNDLYEFVIRDNRIISIVEKFSSEKKFSEIVSLTKPYGIRKYLFNEPARYPDANLKFKPFSNSVKIYGVKGIKGGARRIEGFITRKVITNNQDTIDKLKLFFTTSF